MTSLSLETVFHNGNPKWHSEMVAAVISCQNAIEELLNLYFQTNSVTVAKKASFSSKVDLCANSIGASFPVDACHTLRKLRNSCAHERSRNDNTRQRAILNLLHALDRKLGFTTPLGFSNYRKSFEHISYALCDAVMASLGTKAPPVHLGSIAGPSNEVLELEAYFITPHRVA